MSNPLLEMLRSQSLPPFSQIRPEHAEPALDAVLAANRQVIAELEQLDSPDWDRFVARLEQLDNDLHRVFSPVSHLNGVANSPEWREAYNACLPKLSQYSTELGQNQALYERFEQLRQQADFAHLPQARKTIIDNAIRDFRLAGVHLKGDARARYAAIQQRLSVLQTRFQEQVLDATEAWSWHTDHANDLDGLPERAVQAAAAAAKRQDRSGYLVILDAPSYIAVMTHAHDRSLRQRLYEAFGTRASDQGPHAGQWDNSPVMQEILDLRQELAGLVGFDSYADYSLATKMADSPATVEQFLLDLAAKARPAAEQELQALAAFAVERGGPDTLEPWDIGYYAEQYREATLGLSDEMLRPYFPAPQVLAGMMEVAERLYEVRFEPVADADLWHEDVTAYAVLDGDGSRRGLFYVDPYARPGKRAGAWMDDCQGRYRHGDTAQLPVAFLVCNFGGPVDGKPACLSHDEVETLFHEFGHGLHHLLTQVDELSVSGINGVAWDAVELPSQFMENWTFEREALDRFARHVDTGETIPDTLLEKLRASRRFQAGMATVRQLEFALFDLRLHRDHVPGQPARIGETLDAVRKDVAVIHPPAWHRFPCSFSHIFAGGYAAGYYSYKWAELLAADAFELFAERGVFDAEAARRFRDTILARGGSEPAGQLYEAFRGRPPEPDALLRLHGLAA